MIRHPPRSTLFPYTPLSRSQRRVRGACRQTTPGIASEDKNCRREGGHRQQQQQGCCTDGPEVDRKSTRLNSSHANISYAVFCLKKKKSTERRCCRYTERQ